MKTFIIGLIIGFSLGSVLIGYTSLPLGTRDREFNKFTTDGNGDIAIRLLITQ